MKDICEEELTIGYEHEPILCGKRRDHKGSHVQVVTGNDWYVVAWRNRNDPNDTPKGGD